MSEQPSIQPEEQVEEETSTKKRGGWRSIAAAAMVAAGGVGIHFGKEAIEEHQTEAEAHANEISATLNENHMESPEVEKEAKERYEHNLSNYHIYMKEPLVTPFGYGNMKRDSRFDHGRTLPDMIKARALEIAIKNGVVNPDVSGYKYLWNNISTSGGIAPTFIHFGKTFVTFNENDYTPEEIKFLRKNFGENDDGTIKTPGVPR